MSYYHFFNLKREPFSTSPDPDFFYLSQSHNSALKRLEIALRLRRGLSLILGDVGVGKTTLSRILLQKFNEESDLIFHMVLDPSYISEYQFLNTLGNMFQLKGHFRSTLDYKEALEKYLFQKCVVENKTIALVIDEAQKLSLDSLEILRTLLNYETNEYKLLQLILLSQMELLPRLSKVPNFFDRISLKYIINPLDEEETKKMIQFRLMQAGQDENRQTFTDEAMKLIYEAALGFPRRITFLCHNSLEMAVMKDKNYVDEEIVHSILLEEERILGNEGLAYRKHLAGRKAITAD